MSTPNRTAKKAAAINTAANKARTIPGKAVTQPVKPVAGPGAGRVATPAPGHRPGVKGKGPVYEVPKPVRPKPVKK